MSSAKQQFESHTSIDDETFVSGMSCLAVCDVNKIRLEFYVVR